MVRAKLAEGATSFSFGGHEFVAAADGTVSGLPDDAVADLIRHGHEPMGDPEAPKPAEVPAAAEAEDGGKKKGK
jgi:hypothetical protein